MAISAHRRICLGLPKQLGGRPKQQAADIPEETPDPAEIRDLTLRVFYHRLKTDPASVRTSELAAILREINRDRAAKREKDKGDPLDEAMNDLAAETA